MSTQTFPLTGPINLEVRLGRGSLVVDTADDVTEAAVTLTSAAPDSDSTDRITVALSGPTLIVTAPRQGGLAELLGSRSDRDAVDAHVTVPSGTAMKLTTTAADITVRGRSGGADVGTRSGTIVLGAVSGDLRARSGDSDIDVERVDGSVTIRTGSGSAHVGEVTGSVHAGFGSGDLEIGTAYGAVRSRSGSGDTRVDAVHGDVDLAAGSGRMSIGLPAGVAAKLDVLTGSGEVVSDLPIEQRQQGSGAAISVRARTGLGRVHLFRAVPAD